MKQLQVTVPKDFKDDVEEVLEKYSSDVSSADAEKNDENVIEFTVTAESEDIDDLTEEIKDLDDLKSGELSIRVIKQESLIRKGQKTKGSSSLLSQAELYSQAQESASFNKAQWALIGLASIIASYGILADNLIVVIGAMMVAPILSPFISGALSLKVGDQALLVDSLKSGILSVLVAVVASFIAVIPFPVSMNNTLALVSTPSIISVLLALFVGAAAALTFATGLRDEIAGVAVAIALIPPIASIGIALNMMNIPLLLNSVTVVAMNMIALIVSGFFCFYFLGLKPSTYYRKKQAENIRYLVPVALIIFAALAAPVAYSSYQSYEGFVVKENVRQEAHDYFGEDLLEMRFEDDSLTVYVVGNYSKSEFVSRVPRDLKVNMIELRENN